MKKLLAIVLALALVFSMSVCFAEDAATDAAKEKTKVEATQDTATEEKAEEVAEDAATEEKTEEVAEDAATEEKAEEVTEDAATEEKTEEVTEEVGTEEEAEDVIKVTLDGTPIVFPDQQPVIINGRTLVPLRAIFETIGAVVTWDNDTNTAMAVKGDTYIFVQIDNTLLIKNNEKIELDVPAQLINDRTMVPVRAIVEAFGEYTVDWVDGEVKEVVIATKVEEPAVEEKVEEVAEDAADEGKAEAVAEDEEKAATEEKAEDAEEK